MLLNIFCHANGNNKTFLYHCTNCIVLYAAVLSYILKYFKQRKLKIISISVVMEIMKKNSAKRDTRPLKGMLNSPIYVQVERGSEKEQGEKLA